MGSEGNKTDEILGQLQIDPDPTSYESFLDFKWIKRFSEVTSGSRIDQAAFDLTLSWRSTRAIATSPHVLTKALVSQLKGFIDTSNPFILTLIEDVKKELLITVQNAIRRPLKIEEERELHNWFTKKKVTKAKRKARESYGEIESRVQET